MNQRRRGNTTFGSGNRAGATFGSGCAPRGTGLFGSGHGALHGVFVGAGYACGVTFGSGG